MTTSPIEEVNAALDACRRLDIPPDRIGRSIEPYRNIFLDLSRGRTDHHCESSIAALAREIRNALLIVTLERECAAGRHIHL